MPSNASSQAAGGATAALPIALVNVGLSASFPNLAIYQRTTVSNGLFGLGRGSVPVTVTLASPTLALDFRLRDAVASGNPVLQDWSPAAYALPIGNTTIALPAVPARLGWYFIDLRPNGDASQILLGTAKVGMGDIVAQSGQSLVCNNISANYLGDTVTLASLGIVPSAGTAVYACYGHNGDAAPFTNDPPAWGVPADGTVYNSSFAAEFLNRLSAKTGVNAGLVAFGIGSTAISQWQPGQAYNTRLIALLTAAGGNFCEFQWIQGHADAINGTSSATWQAGLTAIVNQLKADFPAAMFATVVSTIGSLIASTQGTPAAINTIRAAGKAWCAANGGQYIDNLDTVLFTDNIHPSQGGKVTMARHFYRAAARGIGVLATGDAGPAITAASLSGSTVTLTIAETAGTNLVATGTPGSQFSVFPTGTVANPVAVTAVTIVSPTQVTLTLASAPSGAVDIYVRYPLDTTTSITSGVYDNATDGDGLTQGRQLAMNVAAISTGAAAGQSQGSGSADTVAAPLGTTGLLARISPNGTGAITQSSGAISAIAGSDGTSGQAVQGTASAQPALVTVGSLRGIKFTSASSTWLDASSMLSQIQMALEANSGTGPVTIVAVVNLPTTNAIILSDIGQSYATAHVNRTIMGPNAQSAQFRNEFDDAVNNAYALVASGSALPTGTNVLLIGQIQGGQQPLAAVNHTAAVAASNGTAPSPTFSLFDQVTLGARKSGTGTAGSAAVGTFADMTLLDWCVYSGGNLTSGAVATAIAAWGTSNYGTA